MFMTEQISLTGNSQQRVLEIKEPLGPEGAVNVAFQSQANLDTPVAKLYDWRLKGTDLCSVTSLTSNQGPSAAPPSNSSAMAEGGMSSAL